MSLKTVRQTSWNIPVTARLLSFPNVIVTSHQAFFTEEAMEAISHTTLENALGYEKGEIPTGNQV